MRVLILADGDPPSPALAQRLAHEADLRIATDGAANKAAALGLTPDILCGDFDSVDLKAACLAFPAAEVVPTPDQSCADLEKALLLALARGASAIAIIGATGGRMDHTLSSFALLQRYGISLPVCVVADRPVGSLAEQEKLKKEQDGGEQTEQKNCAAVTWAVHANRRCVFATIPGETVSLVTFTNATVSIEGVRWPLTTHDLTPGTLGVSNIADAPHVAVEVHSGSVFVIHASPEPAGFGYYTSQVVTQALIP